MIEIFEVGDRIYEIIYVLKINLVILKNLCFFVVMMSDEFYFILEYLLGGDIVFYVLLFISELYSWVEVID